MNICNEIIKEMLINNINEITKLQFYKILQNHLRHTIKFLIIPNLNCEPQKSCKMIFGTIILFPLIQIHKKSSFQLFKI